MWRACARAARPLAATLGAVAGAHGVSHCEGFTAREPVQHRTTTRQAATRRMTSGGPFLPLAVEPCDFHKCSNGKRIAILGGSFDPITNGHIVSACEVLHADHADEVWIVPCGARPDKPSLKTPYRHRLLMCHQSIDTNFGSRFPIRVSDIEMLEPQALNCFDLMHKLKAEYPEKEFMFVIGTDLFDDLDKWDTGERLEWLLHENKWLVFDRPGYKRPETMRENFNMITALDGMNIAEQELASSEIRKRITKDASGRRDLVDGLIPPAVLAHIIRYNLYSS